MKKNAYEESTIKRVAKRLKHLLKNCNFNDPEAVKLYVANKKCGNGRKESLIESYAIYMRSINQEWYQPFYERYDKKRKAPKEELVDFIINNARMEMKLKLSVFKDLGLRPIELTWIQIKDIDLSTGIVSITGAKHTIGRDGKLRPKTLELLKIYIERKKLNGNHTLYNGKSDNLSADYRHTRNRIAEEYNMPQLKQVQLYDFRRFKASKEYHIRRDFLWVKQILGHKDSRSTEKYISLYDEANITWIPVVCATDEEIKQAIQDDCSFVRPAHSHILGISSSCDKHI